MATYDFDFFVIGGGSAGVRGARMAAAQYGVRVALAECAELGGTCVNVGCIPKKLYSYAAGYADAYKEAAGFGWDFGSKTFDWDRLKANRAEEIKRLNGVYRSLLEGAGVELIQGWAQVNDAHTVQVGEKAFTARHILIATGGMAFVPDIPGREHAVVSDAMFDLAPFPRRLLVVGGGYIACEFASIFNGLGAEVVQLQRNAHLLNGFDEDVREFLAKQMSASGIDIRFNAQIASIRPIEGGLCATLDRGQRIEADTILLATGRKPNTRDMGLEAAGVKLDPHGGVLVDADFRSSVPSIHAVGDVSTRHQLTPVALGEAMVVVDALFGKKKRRFHEDLIPTAVFTHPQVGTCGLGEAAARMLHPQQIDIYSSEFKALRHTLSGSSERTFMKLVVHKGSDRVLGLHMVGPEAGEIVQGFAVAMRAGATKSDFDSTIGIHPTVAEEFVTMRTPNLG
jgi:glutathione reductase (NADPH)